MEQCEDRDIIQSLFLACRDNDFGTLQALIPHTLSHSCRLSHHGLYGVVFTPRGEEKEETHYGYDTCAYSGRSDGNPCSFYTDTDGGGQFYQDHFLPLYFAAAGGHTRCVDYLLRCGAAIDGSNNSGITALMVALNCREGMMVQHLIKKGAQLTPSISGPLVLPQMRDLSAGDLFLRAVVKGDITITNGVGDAIVAEAASEAVAVESITNDTWACSLCTFINSSVRQDCEVCENIKS